MSSAFSLSVATTPLRVCNVALPGRLARRVRGIGGEAGGVALKLEWTSNDEDAVAFVGWTGAISGATAGPSAVQQDQLEVPAALAHTIGLAAALRRAEQHDSRPVMVRVTVMPPPPRATRLELEPCTVDDWEVRRKAHAVMYVCARTHARKCTEITRSRAHVHIHSRAHPCVHTRTRARAGSRGLRGPP